MTKHRAEEPPDPWEAHATEQFCDVWWLEKWSESQKVTLTQKSIVLGEHFHSIGPLGQVHVRPEHAADFSRRLREWATSFDKVAFDYYKSEGAQIERDPKH